MSKYSEEYKLRVVKAYISGESGTETVAKKYKVVRTSLQQWVAQYKLPGSFTKLTRHFSGEFKLKVLNYQRASSFRSANSIDFWNNKSRDNLCVAKEVYYRWYRSSVSETRHTFKNAKKKPNKPREEWTKDEELAYLRMENEYLKKLTALIQEDKQREKGLKEQKSESSKN